MLVEEVYGGGREEGGWEVSAMVGEVILSLICWKRVTELLEPGRMASIHPILSSYDGRGEVHINTFLHPH